MFIQPFTTKRIRAQMRELTLRQAIDLCRIPDQLNQLGISRALDAIIAETDLPLAQWTVQERTAAICHYITAMEEGDWAVTLDTSYSDYLVGKDYPDAVYRFDGLEIVPLTGEYAEACERAVIGQQNVGDWIVAVMAATIRSPDEEWLGGADEFVQENIKRIQELPQSEFETLLSHFQTAWAQMAHGFEMVVTQTGLAVLPQKGGEDRQAVVFRFDEIIGDSIKELWQEPERDGAGDSGTAQPEPE